jgi:hypothetical protein
MSRTLLFIALLFAGSALGQSETIVYEIFELQREGPKSIAKGVRNYTIADVVSKPYVRDGKEIVEKSVELEKGFWIGARVFRESKLTGIGLVSGQSENDFSWDWFSQSFGSQFTKLQGGTTVTVSIFGPPFFEELASVKFNQDTVLRFIASHRGRDDTHQIHVKAGSVLRLR